MLFNGTKKILERLKSLEEFFQLKYTTEDFPEHFVGEYGFLKKLDIRLDSIEKELEQLKAKK